MNHPKFRKSIRLKDYDYSRAGAYFITICTYNRECILGDVTDREMILNQFGKTVLECWNSLTGRYANIGLDKFVVMPNHIHGIIKIIDSVGAIHELPLQGKDCTNQQIERRRMLIPKAIGYFKMNAAKQGNIARNATGIPFWQYNYYEHIIRNVDKLNKIREYIQNNPLKWHLDRENPERTGNDLLEDEIFENLKDDKNESKCSGNS
ncbi:MAG: transposase [Candidatus Brocadia sp. WS118]|nr:MAG: transposase [Candidatus Brocadia sp. WS118]